MSSIDSPLHGLASYIQKILVNCLPVSTNRVINSIDLIRKLNNVRFNDDHVLVSLDAISLSINIPIDLAIGSFNRRWDTISEKCCISKDEFLGAIELILYSTYFTFNRLIYKQNFGTPMGSPLSPVIADLVMQDLETKAGE